MRVRWLLSCAVLAGAPGCSVVFSTDGFAAAGGGGAPDSSADGGRSDASEVGTESGGEVDGSACGVGLKRCAGACVRDDDPLRGCAAAGCAPCDPTGTVDVACTGGACARAGCRDGRLDCDGAPENGCEVDPRADSLHCGNCATRCGCGACAAGVCSDETVPLAVVPAIQGWNLALDADAVYFTVKTVTAGEVRRFDKATGAVTKLADVTAPWGLAVDATTLWMTSSTKPGLVLRVPKTGGAVVAVAGDQGEPRGIALDDKRAYWVDADYSSNGLMAMAKDGAPGSATQLASNFYDVSHVVVDGTTIAWAATKLDEIATCPRDTCADANVTHLTGETRPWDLAADLGDLFWTSAPTNTVRRRIAGVTSDLAHRDPGPPFGVAVDGKNVYFTVAREDGEVIVVDRNKGGSAGDGQVSIATGQPNPAHLKVDEACVYWVNQGKGASGGGLVANSGALMRVKKR